MPENQARNNHRLSRGSNAFTDFADKEQLKSIRAILEEDPDAENMFADLVYVCESMVELELVSEQEIMAVFHRLWPLRGQTDSSAFEAMRDIQTKLRERSELD